MITVSVGPVRGRIEPRGELHARLYGAPVLLRHQQPTSVQVSLNRSAKPGRVALRRHGSTVRTYRLGGWALQEFLVPEWVLNVVDDVMAGAR